MRKRIFGLESEYGALLQHPDGSFSAVDSGLATRVVAEILSSVLHTGSTGAFLPNGARVYCDVGHLEGATAECISVRELIRTIRGLDRFLEVSTSIPLIDGNRVLLIRDNTDSATDDVCFASHENYLFDAREGLFAQGSQETAATLNFSGWFEDLMATHLVTRTIFTGAGILSVRDEDKGRFLLSHRARFIRYVTNNTANQSDRPLILTRKEPHGTGPKGTYQRVQITAGDPNIADVAHYLKFGTTALILRLAEEVGSDVLGIGACVLTDPLVELQRINGDLTFRKQLRCWDFEFRSAIDIQEMLLELCAKHFPQDDDPPEVVKETRDILQRWGAVLSGLRRDPMSLTAELDWPMKKLLIESELTETYGVESLSSIRRVGERKREQLLDCGKTVEQRYHELSERSYAKALRERGLQEVLVSDEEAEAVMYEPSGATNPSLRTRAWIRGKLIEWLLRHRKEDKFNADWESVSIHAGALLRDSPTIAIPFPDPFAWNVREALRIIALP